MCVCVLQCAERLSTPIRSCNTSHDAETLKNLIQRIENNESTNTEQLLPDFYAEHVTLAMNRDRRKQALVRILQLIRQDLERERRGKEDLETLQRAFIKTTTFSADESTQNVADKLYHVCSLRHNAAFFFFMFYVVYVQRLFFFYALSHRCAQWLRTSRLRGTKSAVH